MSTYARISNGLVQELFTPPAGATLAQCFAPAVASQFVDVTTVTPAPQPGWTATETAGAWAFSAPPAPAAPTLAQQAAALLANGLAVTSTGTPAISATYATDATSIQKLIGVELGLAAGQGFPEGAATFPLRTVTGTPPLLTPTQYTTIAALIRNFAAQADLVIDGLSTTLPSNEPPPIA